MRKNIKEAIREIIFDWNKKGLLKYDDTYVKWVEKQIAKYCNDGELLSANKFTKIEEKIFFLTENTYHDNRLDIADSICNELNKRYSIIELEEMLQEADAWKTLFFVNWEYEINKEENKIDFDCSFYDEPIDLYSLFYDSGLFKEQELISMGFPSFNDLPRWKYNNELVEGRYFLKTKYAEDLWDLQKLDEYFGNDVEAIINEFEIKREKEVNEFISNICSDLDNNDLEDFEDIEEFVNADERVDEFSEEEIRRVCQILEKDFENKKQEQVEWEHNMGGQR